MRKIDDISKKYMDRITKIDDEIAKLFSLKQRLADEYSSEIIMALPEHDYAGDADVVDSDI